MTLSTSILTLVMLVSLTSLLLTSSCHESAISRGIYCKEAQGSELNKRNCLTHLKECLPQQQPNFVSLPGQQNSLIPIPTVEKSSQLNKILGILLPWLYFLCTSMNLTTMPGYISQAINRGSTAVSAQAAQVYGNMNGIDAFFTFLSVSYVGRLSDDWGRKPFFLLSCAGLASSYTILLWAKSPSAFYVAALIDGLTSCMLSQAQALVADQQGGAGGGKVGRTSEGDMSIALSRFQGLAIGLAYTLGIPLGNMLAEKYGLKAPLRASIFICLFNFLLISLFLRNNSKSNDNVTSRNKSDIHNKKSQKQLPNFIDVSPIEAGKMLTRNKKLMAGSLCYLLLTLAHAGMSSTWVNFLRHRHNFSRAAAGGTLMVIGLSVAVLPPIFIPILGARRAIAIALTLHSLSLLSLAFARTSTMVYLTLPFLSFGASAMPMLLGYLTEQVGREEVGALQGAGETLRTISNAIGSPFFSMVFALSVSHSGSVPSGAALLLCSFCSAAGAALFSLHSLYNHV